MRTRVLVLLAATLLTQPACGRDGTTPAAFTAPTLNGLPGIGSVDLAPRPAVPLGDAMLQIWGYVLGNAPGPLCQILRAPLLGSVVTTRVRLEEQAGGWLVRAMAGNGDVQMRFSQTGQVTLAGIHLVGAAAGRVLNTIWIEDAGPKEQLSLRIAPGAGSVTAQGVATDTVPFVSGTFTGPSFFEDADGPIVSCTYLYWTLQPLPAL